MYLGQVGPLEVAMATYPILRAANDTIYTASGGQPYEVEGIEVRAKRSLSWLVPVGLAALFLLGRR